MALTKSDKEFIELTLKPIGVEMRGVKEHLGRINGQIQLHSTKIDKNEHAIMEGVVTKKYIRKAITIAGALIAAIWGIVQIAAHFIG